MPQFPKPLLELLFHTQEEDATKRKPFPIDLRPKRQPAEMDQSWLDAIADRAAGKVPKKKEVSSTSQSDSQNQSQQGQQQPTVQTPTFLSPKMAQLASASEWLRSQPDLKSASVAFDVEAPEDREAWERTVEATGGSDSYDERGNLIGRSDLSAQRAGIDRMVGVADRYSTIEPQTDLSPYLSLVDSTTGSSLLKGYTPPPSREELLAKQAAIEDMIQKERGQLTQSDVEFLNALRAKSQGKLGIVKQDLDRQSKDIGKINDVLRAKIIDPSEKALISYELVEQMIKPGKDGKVDLSVIKAMQSVVGKTLLDMSSQQSDKDANRQLKETFDTGIADLERFLINESRVPAKVVEHWRKISAQAKANNMKMFRQKIRGYAEGWNLQYPHLFTADGPGPKLIEDRLKRLEEVFPPLDGSQTNSGKKSSAPKESNIDRLFREFQKNKRAAESVGIKNQKGTVK